MPAPSPRTGAAFRRRALVLLIRLRAAPTPAPLPRTVQRRMLLAVLEDALTAQRPADAAVAACGAPGPVCGEAARDCGRASSAFVHLRARLRDLPLTDLDLVRARAYAGRLLAYDQWMVRQSADLAFSVHPDARTEAARRQLNGLGRPADDLRRLCESLKADTACEAG
ncbi:hypothetical protein ABZT03_06175 [Streptomyces sp. NPDC005574]|uniref:hypothetical protein n=1 Tax=Streptomyces sp. NPDC005574 TaxID=3156891 RepID=UPI00339E1EFE